MSWSGKGTLDSADAVGNFNVIEQKGHGESESVEQISSAIEAARTLIKSGHIGAEGPFDVTLYGHANPDHKDAEGYAKESITVTVTKGQQAI